MLPMADASIVAIFLCSFISPASRPNTSEVLPIQSVLVAYKSKVDQDERPYKIVSL
jgi:hypothetical protein